MTHSRLLQMAMKMGSRDYHARIESESGSLPSENDQKLTDVEKVAQLYFKHGLTLEAVRDIAALLREKGAVLPEDLRTIVRTSRNTVRSTSFVYFGLKSGLLRKLKNGIPRRTRVIEYQLKCDGLPVHEKTVMGLWPTLARITKSVDRRPFTVSAWCGEGKPPSVDEYVEKLIEEALDLQKNGFKLNGKTYRIKFDAIICDSPARCFVKKCKAHNGKGGCERCIQHGSRRREKWTYQDISAALRTDDSFRNMPRSPSWPISFREA
jgi:hypothetical protein